MAKGRANCPGCWALLGVILYTVLVLTSVLPNPLPAVWEWVNRESPIAPDLAWQERLGSRPDSVIAARNAVAIEFGTSAELRRLTTGSLITPLRPAQWPADWMAVAGGPDDAVVVTGVLLEKGYQVRDPGTGVIMRRDEEAVAVWTYRDALLDVRCTGPQSCELRAYQPTGREPRWRASLPGIGFVLFADNPELAGARQLTASRVDDQVSGPAPLPPLLGLPMDRQVIVVETATGRIVRQVEPRRNEQVTVIGGRIINSVTTSRDGICTVAVTGHDAVTGLPVWGPYPYHLRTISGAACDQPRAPVAAGAAMIGVTPEGHEVVIDAYDGRVLWTAAAEGERVQGLSERLAVIRSADQTTLSVLALGGSAPLWQRQVHEDAAVTLTRCGVVLHERRPDRVFLLDPGTGVEVMSVPTGARVAACVPGGLLLSDGRSIGYATAAAVPAPAAPAPAAPTSPSAAPVNPKG